MSHASIGGGFHFRFSVGVQYPTETLNAALCALLKRVYICERVIFYGNENEKESQPFS